MPYTIRVSLPGYNALTDSNPNHYALFVDPSQDYILIKEKSRGTINVDAGGSSSVAHNLGYIPFWAAYVRDVSFAQPTYQFVYGFGIYAFFRTKADTTNIYFFNRQGSAADFRYYIFHDKGT